jgi:hypothetical protein
MILLDQKRPEQNNLSTPTFSPTLRLSPILSPPSLPPPFYSFIAIAPPARAFYSTTGLQSCLLDGIN